MSKLVIEAQPRDVQASKARHLRNQGLLPINVYGKGQAPVSLVVVEKQMNTMLHAGGASQLIEVQVVGGGVHNVLIKEIQRQPVGHRVLHVDMMSVRMDEKQHVNVPITRTGKPEDLGAGFMMLQNLETVLIEALPADIPAYIEVDIAGLTPDNPIRVADLPAIAGVTYLLDDDEHVFAMVATRVSAEEEELGAGEGSAEPEVVGRAAEAEE